MKWKDRMRNLINKPKYIFVVYLCIIIFFTFLYWLLPVGTFENKVRDELSLVQSLYLSIVTITTLGYGDITPKNNTGMLVASLEALIGVLIVGFFINSVWKNILDKMENDQQEKIKEAIKERNRNNLSSYYAYLSSVLYKYKVSVFEMTTPLEVRHVKKKFDYNFKFSDLQNIFFPSLLMRYGFRKSVLEIYFESESELVTELKYLLASFNLEDFQGIRKNIISFISIGHMSDLKETLLPYVKKPEEGSHLQEMIKQFDQLPPERYHQNNVLSPVILLYQIIPLKMKIFEAIVNEFKKVTKDNNDELDEVKHDL